MFIKINSVLLLLLFSFLSVSSQNNLNFQEKFKLNISKASSKIKIDGLLDEETWKTAEQTSDFWKKWPNDDGRPARQTYVKMSYDDQYLYIGIKAIDTNYYVVQSLKRDQGFFSSDAVAIAIDPVNQKTNGFIFGLTPYNVQSEDLVGNGQSSGELSFSWDNKWFSATTRYPNYWIAEIAIPFKTLRFKEGKTKWGINFLRNDVKNNEFSSWTKMPTNFPFYDFGYAGLLNWNTPPPAPGTNISTIPYVSSLQSSDKEANQPWSGKLNGGFDSKIALSSSLNMDLTVNPDFSQVEADQQVTNLTRFNIFFPEKRTFFLENDDLFSNFGIPPIRPFYSRTIGLDNNGNRIPILAGVRISGNVTKKMRVGLMNMQTLAKNDAAAQNYTAFTFNHQVQSRSSVTGYFFNRQGIEDKDHRFKNPLDKFGRNVGVEYNFLDITGKWNAWSGHHLSFKDGIKNPGYYTNTGGGYFSKEWNLIFDLTQISKKYYTDMGFISRIENYDALLDTTTRLGYKQIFNEISHIFYPKKGKVTQIKLSTSNIIFLTPSLNFNESIHELKLGFTFRNTSYLMLGSSYNANNLLFNTSFTDKLPIPPGKYSAGSGSITYGSDIKKKISYTATLAGGKFFNGSMVQYELITKYRVQPWGNFAMSFQQTKLTFPEIYGSSNLFLIAPRIEINFSNNLSWSTFLQYNNQRNNFNINSKIQWRYKPMSDIFLVYSDNYFTDPNLKNKNRALVFKMNYWLNL